MAAELWELQAREAIRDAIAAYTHLGDRLLVDELVEQVFCEDATLEIRRDDRSYVGRAAIAERLRSRPGREPATPGRRRLLRHNVTNIRFDAVTPTRADVSSYFTVLTDAGLDHFGRYRDVFVPVGDHWLIQHRLVSRDWHRDDAADPRPREDQQ